MCPIYSHAVHLSYTILCCSIYKYLHMYILLSTLYSLFCLCVCVARIISFFFFFWRSGHRVAPCSKQRVSAVGIWFGCRTPNTNPSTIVPRSHAEQSLQSPTLAVVDPLARSAAVVFIHTFFSIYYNNVCRKNLIRNCQVIRSCIWKPRLVLCL